ncbi:hypothetical protein GZ77_03580 [Endozoicomonas montiporae]|uniref:Uncharacterized protein n=2 Tax=Endozoicomonas montiporae TaxID=1027273 RepID=A0A081NB47_9GAMM|nr:hypothetical protein [Endozoicomonas montiporae]AMO56617.1 hypothetical protein EZMO1_2538 [Endozoicomonas montiporae CL-33]KEQ15670.1 hypothetical protein GZ77_03580 [Endozoicomonas montiporae]
MRAYKFVVTYTLLGGQSCHLFYGEDEGAAWINLFDRVNEERMDCINRYFLELPIKSIELIGDVTDELKEIDEFCPF